MPVREVGSIPADEPAGLSIPGGIRAKRCGRRIGHSRKLVVRDLAERLEVLHDPRQLPGQGVRLRRGELEGGEVRHLRNELAVDLH